MVKRVTKSSDIPAVNLKKYEKDSVLIWSRNNIQLPNRATWNFKHRAWQVDIFDDKHPRIVIKKPTQVGITLIMLCKVLHFACFEHGRIMYTLPRQDDVTDLVNTRVMELIRNSNVLTGKIGNVDNVRLKKIGDTHIHFMESSVTPRMLDVDFLVNDEVDISDPDNLDQYVARLDASDRKIHYKLSTPTLHGFGIDVEYDKSDQREWLVKCPSCNEYQALDWNKNIKRRDGITWYVCWKCDKVFTPEIIQSGEWVAQNRSSDVHGYTINQMMSTYITPNDLWKEYQDRSPKNFYNLRLGLAYSPTTGSITRSSLLERCFRSEHKPELGGKGYILGADQGNDIHVAIGKVEDDILKIVYLDVIPFEEGFEKLEKLIDRFGVHKAVIDALPNRHSASQLASRSRARQVLLAYYTRIDTIYRESRDENKINISKADAFDALVERINAGELQFYGEGVALDTFTRRALGHLSNMRRDEEIVKSRLGGDKVMSRWINTGADHFADAINYLNIAADLKGTASFTVKVIGDDTRYGPPDEDNDNREKVSRNPYAERTQGLKRIRIGR